MSTEPTNPGATRRGFLKTSAAAGAVLAVAPGVHAGGGDTLKIGLIGCGSRGTGAAAQALNADKNVQLVAMADAFEDRLQESLKILKDDAQIAAKVDVKPERRFVGFNAYKDVLASEVDVVLLTTPPHFRPMHFEAAIKADKHVFAEKPVAVDAPGVRSVLDTVGLAKKRGLAVVSGLCLRSDNGVPGTGQGIPGGAGRDLA